MNYSKVRQKVIIFGDYYFFRDTMSDLAYLNNEADISPLISKTFASTKSLTTDQIIRAIYTRKNKTYKRHIKKCLIEEQVLGAVLR